jgi:hypothetical protein
MGRDAILEIFSRPLLDLIMSVDIPRTASWAKFSRPYGTEFGILVLTQAL